MAQTTKPKSSKPRKAKPRAKTSTVIEEYEKMRLSQAHDRKALEDRMNKSCEMCTIIFVDLVGSTNYKIKNKDNPTKWIYRQWTFLMAVGTAIQNSSGTVVKYIGDAVMGVFRGPNHAKDAQKFVESISDVRESIASDAGSLVELKIGLDIGKAYFLSLPGHQEPDPAGTVVDRCSRIEGLASANDYLASKAFVDTLTGPSKQNWQEHTTTQLRGFTEYTEIFRFNVGERAKMTKMNLSQRDIDIQTLTLLLGEISWDAINEHQKSLPFSIPHRIFHFWEGVIATRRHVSFNLFDKVALQLVDNFIDAWAQTLSESKHFIPGQGDCYNFSSSFTKPSELERAQNNLQDGAIKLETSSKALLAYLRANYAEINIDSLSRSAWQNYLAYQSN